MARCAECGCPVDPGNKWCSDACKERWTEKREEVTCRVCGAAFWRVRGRHDRVCSRCRWRQRKKDGMAYGSARKDVICPYYKRETRYTLVCEGPAEGVNAQLNFASPRDRRAHMADFCTEKCWPGCWIAAMAAEKYEK